jgi:hypothetical protein
MSLATATPGYSPAMDRAEAEITRAFGFPEVAFKQRVRRFARRGAADPANWARYGARVRLLRNATLEQAAILTDGWYRRERDALRNKYAIGGATRLSVEVLKELRLMVRFARAKRLDLQPVIADVLGEDRMQAAE